MNTSCKKSFAAMAFALICAPAISATQYTLDAGPANATVTSWAASNNTTNLSQGALEYYTGGLGASYAGESSTSPNHALDNAGRYESFLLNFGSDKVRLESVTVGWPTTSGYDTDFFVLAYTGTTAPTLSSLTYQTMTTANGWQLISLFPNPGDGTVSLDLSKNIYSSFWLIGAGGFSSGTGVTSGDKNTDGTWKSLTSTRPERYDYIKVAGVGGVTNGGGTGGGGGSAPEPGSLALAGAAFLGMVGMRRRKAAV